VKKSVLLIGGGNAEPVGIFAPVLKLGQKSPNNLHDKTAQNCKMHLDEKRLSVRLAGTFFAN
jgi:hypothetical protein